GKLQQCLKDGRGEIVITDEDIGKLKQNLNREDTISRLPPSFSVMFKIVQKDDDLNNEDYILIENVGGSSAANLLGRFAYNDKRIYDHVQQICDMEVAHNEDVIFAEIIHLPQN